MTGAVAYGRADHRSTRLFNGKVRVRGGRDSSNAALSSAEIYSPEGGAWAAATPMIAKRMWHTATLMPNGKVLVAGGFSPGNGYASSAEWYDPTSGKWTAISSMNTGREQHTATLLPNGKVLVAGGDQGFTYLSSAEVYDPAFGFWVTVGSMTSKRTFHTASLLANGMVLVTAGYDGTNILTSAELYDPVASSWRLTGALTNARIGHASVALPDGRALTVGGYNNSGVVSNAESYAIGLGYDVSWQAQIASLSSPLGLGNSFAMTGSGFRGVSEGSGGNTQDSPTDFPLVQLRSLESGQTTFLLCTYWSTNSFASAAVWGFPLGWAMATAFVNGIPSTGSLINISVPVPTAMTLTGVKIVTNGFQFSFTNSVGAVFGVLASTNVGLPLSNWTALGGVAETSPGQFQFTDAQATNGLRRFYCVRAL